MSLSLEFQEMATEGLLCSSICSVAEGGYMPYYSGGSSDREDETHIYAQVKPSLFSELSSLHMHI